MPSRRRDHPRLVPALFAQWERDAAVVDALPDQAFTGPSRLPGWSTADLVAHLTRSATALVTALAADRPAPTVPTASATGYLSLVTAAADGIADRARSEAAGQTPTALRARLRSDVAAAADALSDADLDDHVLVRARAVRLGDYLVTRVVEAAVHGLDLGADLDPDAGVIAARVMADLLAERAPGRSVEVRVPPRVAVQVVAGPRHTRGTPPNTVQTDPTTFLELATGRVDWAAMVAEGRLRASGARADLSNYLPLL